MILRLVFIAAMLLSGLAFGQTSPIIMKHADSLAVARKRGTLVLHGRVHFVHDSVQFKTQRAVWNKDGEVVQCEGGFVFTHPSGFIDAHNGVYHKKQGLASARGDVHAGDSAHTYYFTGEYLEYDKENEILTMPDKPVLRQFEKRKDGGEDTITIVAKRIVYNKKDGDADARGDVTITQKDVTISADMMNYSRTNDFAEAFNHVKLVQNDMVVTCDTGYFDRKNSWLSMKGNPTCDLKNYHLTGDSIFLVLDSAGTSLKSALVIRNAHGIQQEDAKKNGPGSVTEAFGDTLYAEFDGNKIERLYVNLNARGFFYETDLEDYRNLMDGNRLDLYFNKGKMDKAVVSGKAQSTYFYVKKDRSVSGKNEASGDTIHILFDAAKNAVKSLKLLGNSTMASGRYVDLEKERRNREAAQKDSLAKADSIKSLTKIREPDDIKSVKGTSEKHAEKEPETDPEKNIDREKGLKLQEKLRKRMESRNKKKKNNGITPTDSPAENVNSRTEEEKK